MIPGAHNADSRGRGRHPHTYKDTTMRVPKKSQYPVYLTDTHEAGDESQEKGISKDELGLEHEITTVDGWGKGFGDCRVERRCENRSRKKRNEIEGRWRRRRVV